MGLFARMGDVAKGVAKDVSGVSAVQALISGGPPKDDLRAFAGGAFGFDPKTMTARKL